MSGAMGKATWRFHFQRSSDQIVEEVKRNMEKQTVFKEEETENSKVSETKKGKTSSGLDENLAGLLCYLFGFITGIIFLLIEKDNRFVRFHALQSIFTFAAIFVVSMVINVIPLLGLLISVLLMPLSLVLWVVLMVQAYQGKWFKLPIIGELVEKQLK